MSKFKVGDKVEVVRASYTGHVTTNQGSRSMSNGDLVSVVEAVGKYIDVELSCGSRANGLLGSRFKLVEQVPDMTKNERPFGLLSKEEQKVLSENLNDLEYYTSTGWRTKTHASGLFGSTISYRVKPKPLRVPVHEIPGTVEMVDGKPNWNSYKED